MRSFLLRVPGKAMLFGEYGALMCGTVAAVACGSVFFEIEVTLDTSILPGVCIVESSFLDSGSLLLDFNQIDFQFSEMSTQHSFFKAIVLPWKKEIVDLKSGIRIQVLKSFSPSLGLGSSSAILAAVHFAFSKLILGNTNCVDFKELSESKTFAIENSFWNKAMQSLHLMQGKGSGYDVAVQLASMQIVDSANGNVAQITPHSHDLLFKYRLNYWLNSADKNQFISPFLSLIPVSTIRKTNLLKSTPMGFLLGSGIYSSTTQALKTHKSANFMIANSQLAADFFEGKRPLCELMAESRQLSLAEGLWGNIDSSYHQLALQLEENRIHFKSMGSGYGDCFWIAENPERLQGLNHVITGKPLIESVVHVFNII